MERDQLSLDFGASVLPDFHYFAVRPSPAAAGAVVTLAQGCREGFGLTGRPYDADRLHISLSQVESLAGPRKDDLMAAQRAADRVRRTPFAVAFDRLCTFQGRRPHPVVLCCTEGEADLLQLRDALRRELVRVGLSRGKKQFKPHLTLLWDRCRVPETCLSEPIRWFVEDFVLVRSLFGRSRQTDLGRWPLRA